MLHGRPFYLNHALCHGTQAMAYTGTCLPPGKTGTENRHLKPASNRNTCPFREFLHFRQHAPPLHLPEPPCPSGLRRNAASQKTPIKQASSQTIQQPIERSFHFLHRSALTNRSPLSGFRAFFPCGPEAARKAKPALIPFSRSVAPCSIHAVHGPDIRFFSAPQAAPTLPAPGVLTCALTIRHSVACHPSLPAFRVLHA